MMGYVWMCFNFVRCSMTTSAASSVALSPYVALCLCRSLTVLLSQCDLSLSHSLTASLSHSFALAFCRLFIVLLVFSVLDNSSLPVSCTSSFLFPSPPSPSASSSAAETSDRGRSAAVSFSHYGSCAGSRMVCRTQ
jgi:hypothetical protein